MKPIRKRDLIDALRGVDDSAYIETNTSGGVVGVSHVTGFRAVLECDTKPEHETKLEELQGELDKAESDADNYEAALRQIEDVLNGDESATDQISEIRKIVDDEI